MIPEISQKPIIVVLGMHRSGTSLTTRALQVLGIDLGEHLIPGIDGDNEKGFWEDIEINDFDNALLERVGSSWDRLTPLDEGMQTSELAEERQAAVTMLEGKVKSTEIFGFKDPRTAILLPFWQTVFATLKLEDRYVIAVRNPLNVAKSLLERNALPIEAGILLWAKHMNGMLRQTQGKRRLVVDFDLMLEFPSAQIQRISSNLSLPLDEACEQRLNSFEAEFVSRDLRHHDASLEDLKNSELIPEFVKEAYEWMLRLATDEVEFDNIELENFWNRFEDTFQSFNSAYQYIDRLMLSLHQYKGENKSLIDTLLEKEQCYQIVEKERDNVVGEIEKIRQQLHQASSELDGAKKQSQQLSNELNGSKKQSQQLSNELNGSKKQSQQLSNELNDSKKLCQIANNELDEVRKSQQKSKTLLQKTKDELEASRKRQLESRQSLEKAEGELTKSRELQRESMVLYQHAVGERDNREKSYKTLHEDFKQAVAERDKVQVAGQNHVNENAVLRDQIEGIRNSYSWRLTGGFRAIHHYSIQPLVNFLRKIIKNVLNAIWERLPIGPASKSRLKKRLFKHLPLIFSRTRSFRDWQANNASALNKVSYSSSLSKDREKSLSGDEKDPYVPMNNNRALTKLPVRLVAFYLPQFHEIPENNEWWGEGFTEWTNVKPAKPQFKGHYQPHVPGELGYYDLTDPSVQKRQVELAKQFGIGGFCFYFYWFSGKRLLEAPILNYLNDASLNLPFCLCWANENWSRRWDGLEDDVLIGQQHSAEDDIAFIEYVSRYLRDPRNMQINGRPLLLVYRPSLLPSPSETAQRWRTWCRDNGFGEIYLAYTQSFEAEDPAIYGFDAAVEFPPNNSGPPEITEQVEQLSSEFTGIVYDWRIFVERSKNYQQPDYTLFRSVTPSWDNTARHKTAGAIFANSSPADYQAWLTRAIENTLAHQENHDERLVFVNAWNEWAEGAYLEPDEKYGYAYLQSTRAALENVVKEKGKRRILLVIHDAYPHGAQYLMLNMAKVLHESMGFVVEMIVLGNGPLIEEYQKYANIHELAGHDVQGKETADLVKQLSAQGISSAITNTTVTGLIVPVLKQNEFTVVSLIHELPTLIKDYQLQEHVKAIAREADKVVFAATAVRQGFESFVRLDKGKVIIRPQGLYKKNSLQTKSEIQAAKQVLHKRFNLSEEAKIVLGVGFADHRKGIDIFVESGINVLKKNKNVCFIWLGDFETRIESKIKQSIKKSGLDHHFIFPGLECDSDIYYAGADIYALTSREDPFPSVVLEALDAVTPVVAFTESGGAGELLSRGGGVLVDEMNAKAFSVALMELIENPDKAYQIGLAGKKIIDEEFSFRKYLFDLTNLADTGLQRISVVLPNYNYEQYLEGRLETICSQNYPLYEIIILDDASTDNSKKVILDFIQNHVVDCKLIANEDNSGSVFKQWAKGVTLADGDYVWIAEADDLSDPEFLDEVMKGFDDDSTVMSYCESKQMDSKGNILCESYLDYVSDISRDKWLSSYKENGINEITGSLAIKNTIPNVSAVVFNRNALSRVLNENINEIKQYKNAGDWLAYIYLLNYGGIAYSSKSLNYHRRHENSVTISGFNIRQLEEIMAVQKKVKDLYEVDEDVVTLAKLYSQVLYEQFGLNTKAEPTVEQSEVLKKYLGR